MASGRLIKILQALTAAGFSNVIVYGDELPVAPYVVVKPGKDSLGRGANIMVFSHRSKSQQVKLDEDIALIIETLQDTLYYDPGTFNPTYVVNSDDSLSREQSFLMVAKY